jgi:hypothetical protein
MEFGSQDFGFPKIEKKKIPESKRKSRFIKKEIKEPSIPQEFLAKKYGLIL